MDRHKEKKETREGEKWEREWEREEGKGGVGEKESEREVNNIAEGLRSYRLCRRLNYFT